MDLQLTDRVFIVTGATRGLGHATAEILVAEGARVVISGRHQSAVSDTATALGGNAVGIAVDNADPQAPALLIEAAQSAWGRLDGALLSVGGPAAGSVLEASDDAWTTAFESVLLGGVRLGREIGRELKPGGALAFVLSSSVRQPVPGLAISNGLRPGLAMIAKTLADELGPRGVRVNGLLPGRLATERLRELDAATGDPAAAAARWAAEIPLGRYGRPEEFGQVAAFLLSPAASYLTGTMIPVDGGLLRAL